MLVERSTDSTSERREAAASGNGCRPSTPTLASSERPPSPICHLSVTPTSPPLVTLGMETGRSSMTKRLWLTFTALALGAAVVVYYQFGAVQAEAPTLRSVEATRGVIAYSATKRPRLVWLLAGRPLMARVASPPPVAGVRRPACRPALASADEEPVGWHRRLARHIGSCRTCRPSSATATLQPCDPQDPGGGRSEHVLRGDRRHVVTADTCASRLPNALADSRMRHRGVAPDVCPTRVRG